jgi:hypothetical protein
MICPHCNREIPDSTVAAAFAAVGGKAGTGKSKARTREQAQAAAHARWLKCEPGFHRCVICGETCPDSEPDCDRCRKSLGPPYPKK